VLHSYSHYRGDELVSSREMKCFELHPILGGGRREHVDEVQTNGWNSLASTSPSKIRSGQVTVLYYSTYSRRSDTVTLPHQFTPGFLHRDQNCRIWRSAAGTRLRVVPNIYSTKDSTYYVQYYTSYSKGCRTVRPHANQGPGLSRVESPPNNAKHTESSSC